MNSGPGTRPRDRISLAMRTHGWGDDQSATEQRLKDLAIVGDSLRRRWGVIVLGAALLIIGQLAGYFPASLKTVGAVVATAVVINVALDALLRRSWRRWWWQIYALALFDIALAGTLVTFFGPGGLVVGFFLAILPYTFDQARALGNVLVASAGVAYLAAAALHGVIFEEPPRALLDLPTTVYLETLVFLAVAVTLRRIVATLIRRIQVTRAVVAQAERGQLTVRAPAERSDELGFLETSFNRMLRETEATVSEVQREADEVAVFAEVLANRVEQMLTSSQQVAGIASDLARGMGEQRDLAERGHTASAAAAEQALGLRSRAELTENDARQLLEATERGRERVARASETLVSIGREVSTTAASVQELSKRSKRISDFTQTIAKIARQTHLLALNAAIEAARAEQHGQGFAAVADQIRELAGEAARSARDIAGVVTEVRTGIDAVAQAMTAGEAQVRDVGVVAEEARSALQDIHGGVRGAAELVTATAEVSRDQAERMSTLAEQMSRMAQISSQFSAGADDAARVMSAQISAMDDLNQASQQIGGLADQLRASIARFTVRADG